MACPSDGPRCNSPSHLPRDPRSLATPPYPTDVSDVDDARELLESVEEEIALFDCRLVEGILEVGPRAAHHPIHLVNLAAQPRGGNEP